MKLIQYDIQGKEINTYQSLELASIVLNVEKEKLCMLVRYGYRLDDGSVLKKFKEVDQTDIAFRDHVVHGTLRPTLEKKYSVNAAKLKKLIDDFQEKRTLDKAYKYWTSEEGHDKTVQTIAAMFDVTSHKLHKYISNALRPKRTTATTNRG